MQPDAHLWENGSGPIDEMNRLLELRGHALQNLGHDNIPSGTPVSELEKVLVPVYLMHRYQVEAVAKQIGGYHYVYEVKGGADKGGIQPVDSDVQAEAIGVLAASMSPVALALPDHLKDMIPPTAMGYRRDRELFKTRNGGGFDPLAMAETAADNNLKFLLHHHRLARIVEQRALFPGKVALEFTLPKYLLFLGNFTHGEVANAKNDYHRQIAQIVEKRFVAHLLQAAANGGASEQVRAGAMGELVHIKNRVKELAKAGEINGDHYLYVSKEIKQYLSDPTSVKVAPAPALPDGSPIGCGELH
jgi:hypothetical protein